MRTQKLNSWKMKINFKKGIWWHVSWHLTAFLIKWTENQITILDRNFFLHADRKHLFCFSWMVFKNAIYNSFAKVKKKRGLQILIHFWFKKFCCVIFFKCSFPSNELLADKEIRFAPSKTDGQDIFQFLGQHIWRK